MKRLCTGRWLPLLAVIAIVAACSPAPIAGPAATASIPTVASAPSTATTLPAAPPPTALAPGGTAFDAVLSMLGPAGEVNPEIALQAFALAVAPLSGVTPPAGAPGHLDADAAVAWVSQVRDQLSPAQQAAIDAALAAMPDPFQAGGSPPAAASGLTLAAWQPVVTAAGPECGLLDSESAGALTSIPPAIQPYADMMQAAAGTIASHLRRPALPKLAVCLVPAGILASTSLTRLFDAEHTRLGLPASCSIFLSADKIGDLSDGDLGYLMAYQTFNCFAATADPAETLASFGIRKIAPWVRGGTAAWAGATVAAELFGGTGDGVSELWAGYLTEPHFSLFQRTNSAIGFFAQVNQDRPTAWDVLDETLLAGDALDAFYAATGRRQSFVDLWAAGYFRDASRGPDWDIVGPGIAGDTAEAGSIEVANGESQDMAAPAMAVATADLSTSADVTVLAGNHLRVHDGVQDLKDVRNQAYCTRDGSAGACACPKGSPGAARPPLPSLNPEAKLALTGMEFGGTATIQGLSLEAYCGAQPTSEPGGTVWSMVFWSPDLGDSVPPLLAAYTCDGLVSTWKVIYLPGGGPLERAFELPFAAEPVVHQDLHFDVPANKQSNAQKLDYALDFALDPTSNPPVFRVTGTKTESEGDQSRVLVPREFGADAPLPLENVSLETQLKPYPQYQHPFRTQAAQECGE